MAAQQPNQSDNSMGVLWIICAIFFVAALVWYYLKDIIVQYYLKLKLLELNLIGLLTDRFEDVRITVVSTSARNFSFDDLLRVSDAMGDFVGIPCAILIAFLACLVYLSNTSRKFKRTYSMRSLLLAEQANWPQISPVAKLDLVKTPLDQGPWAMAMTPMQFCKKHDLLEEYRRPLQEGMLRKHANKIEVALRRGQANKVFIMQLGPLWAGPERLPPYAKALFTIFAARYNSDSQAAFQLLRQLNVSCTTKLDFRGVDALCKKHANTKGIQAIVKGHAYVLTIMASMLEKAREDGVQASADFLWLKPLDRRLWYMLNTVGRQTPFVEVAGPFAHWVAEKELGKKLLVPMVDEATNALEKALKEIVYKPDDDE